MMKQRIRQKRKLPKLLILKPPRPQPKPLRKGMRNLSRKLRRKLPSLLKLKIMGRKLQKRRQLEIVFCGI